MYISVNNLFTKACAVGVCYSMQLYHTNNTLEYTTKKLCVYIIHIICICFEKLKKTNKKVFLLLVITLLYRKSGLSLRPQQH